MFGPRKEIVTSAEVLFNNLFTLEIILSFWRTLAILFPCVYFSQTRVNRHSKFIWTLKFAWFDRSQDDRSVWAETLFQRYDLFEQEIEMGKRWDGQKFTLVYFLKPEFMRGWVWSKSNEKITYMYLQLYVQKYLWAILVCPAKSTRRQ